MSELMDDERRGWITGTDARMDAYYYCFKPTGNELIDQILSAVAYAGKGSHHTEAWFEELDYEYGPVPKGGTFEGLIQDAAVDAAARLAAHDAEVEKRVRGEVAEAIEREYRQLRRVSLERDDEYVGRRVGLHRAARLARGDA